MSHQKGSITSLADASASAVKFTHTHTRVSCHGAVAATSHHAADVNMSQTYWRIRWVIRHATTATNNK